jgi:hypothetical protein
MSETLEAPADDTTEAPRPAEIRGLVDNATDQKLYGWAWNAANPGERLSIEIRVKDEVMARGVADRERKDLAKAGIGDGCHAFELPLMPGWAQRPGDLSVVARAADGAEMPLALRVQRADLDPGGALLRMLEATAAAHRQLREDLAALAARLPTEDPARDEALRGLAANQAELNEKLDSLTIWLARLDDRLSALSSPPPAPRRRVDAWQVALGALVFVVLAGAGLGTLGKLVLPG